MKAIYKLTRQSTHPKATSSGDVYEHYLVAERALGKPLPIGAEVHHVDLDTKNNANRNLVICQDREYHALLHVRLRVVRAGGNPNTQRICSRCEQVKDFREFNRRMAIKADNLSRWCRECYRQSNRERWLRRTNAA